MNDWHTLGKVTFGPHCTWSQQHSVVLTTAFFPEHWIFSMIVSWFSPTSLGALPLTLLHSQSSSGQAQSFSLSSSHSMLPHRISDTHSCKTLVTTDTAHDSQVCIYNPDFSTELPIWILKCLLGYLHYMSQRHVIFNIPENAFTCSSSHIPCSFSVFPTGILHSQKLMNSPSSFSFILQI